MSDRNVTVTVTENGKVVATADLTTQEYRRFVSYPMEDALDDSTYAHDLREQDTERFKELAEFSANALEATTDVADLSTETTIHYEVWRSHLRGGPDVCLYRDLDEEGGPKTLALCEADKAEAYPDAPVEFCLIRATTTRERVVT